MNPPARWIAAAALLLSVAAPFVITVEPPAPPEGWHVNLRWAPGVDDEARRELEAEYKLRLLQPHSERTFVYRLGDPSRTNIRALVRDPRVEDTHGIDRQEFSVPAPRVTLARRYLDEHEDQLGRAASLFSLKNALLLLAAAFAWRASRSARIGRFLSRGIPPMSSAALGLYRFSLGMALIAVVLKYNDLPDAPFPRELHRAHDWFADWEWVHALATRPDVSSWTTAVSVVLLSAFALGVLARPAYAAFLVVLTAHVLVVLQYKSAHDWGLPLVALWGLAVVPWDEGLGIDRLRNAAPPSTRDYGFAAWFPGLMIGLAFLAAAYAKLDSSGLEWITGGAVKYHFIEDSRQAPTTWGLWVAARDTLAVSLSAAAIVVEGCFILHVFFRSARVRAAFGLAGLALLVGFRVLQGVVWTQWWVLFLCFVPWQAIAGRLRAARAAAPERMPALLPGSAAASLVALVVVVQLFASAHRFEAEPFVSDYGMYSWTWPGRDAFDLQIGRRYREYSYRTVSDDGAVLDVTDRVRALPKGADLIDDAVDAARRGDDRGEERRRALAALSAAYRETFGETLTQLAVVVDEQAFDWKRGRFYRVADDRAVGIFNLQTGELAADPAAAMRVERP